MESKDEQKPPVNAKAVLIDPATMSVAWVNDAAAQAFSSRGGSPAVSEIPVEQVVPMPGAVEALQAVADTGVAKHLRADLISSARGSVAVVTSIYRLPDGMLLVLTENAFHVGRGGADERTPRRSGRRGR